MGAEASVLIKSIQRASEMLEAGATREVSIQSERMVTLIRVLNDSYFIAVTLRPEGNLGKARYLLRVEPGQGYRIVAEGRAAGRRPDEAAMTRPLVSARDLSKTYRVYRKREGLWASLTGLFQVQNIRSGRCLSAAGGGRVAGRV